MKSFLILVIVAVLGTAIAQNPSGDELMRNLKLKYMKSYLQERQALQNVTGRLEKVCPGSSIALEDALTKVKTCTDEIDELSETACSIVRTHMTKCLDPVMKVLEDCLPKQSKEVPRFLLKSIISAADYVCKTDGEHIFELGNSCVYQQNYRTSRCIRKIKSKFQQFQRSSPTKDDFCDAATSLKSCIQSHLNFACGNQITRQAFIGIYDAFLSACPLTRVAQASNEISDVETFDLPEFRYFKPKRVESY